MWISAPSLGRSWFFCFMCVLLFDGPSTPLISVFSSSCVVHLYIVTRVPMPPNLPLPDNPNQSKNAFQCFPLRSLHVSVTPVKSNHINPFPSHSAQIHIPQPTNRHSMRIDQLFNPTPPPHRPPYPPTCPAARTARRTMPCPPSTGCCWCCCSHRSRRPRWSRPRRSRHRCRRPCIVLFAGR